LQRAGNEKQNSGEWSREIAKLCLELKLSLELEQRHCEEHLRRSNPFFRFVARWIASRSLSSGARSRDPVARNDV
jgi:hypothetical protein